MVLSEIEQQRALREAREIMKLGEKWQQLMPGEKRPNFERAAREVLRRALGHQVVKNQEALDIHGGLMHEHQPREAHLLERYLKSGTVHPDVMHSFVHGDVYTDPEHPDPHETHANRLVEKQVPESAALPAAYQAVH